LEGDDLVEFIPAARNKYVILFMMFCGLFLSCYWNLAL